jgi:hypothetical protein
MPTNALGTVARLYHTHQPHYLRRRILFSAGNGATISLGLVPAGATIIRAGVVVRTAFNAGTTNTLDIGVGGALTSIASAAALGTVGVIVSTTLATSTQSFRAADTEVVATLNVTGTTATTGECYAFIEYLVSDGTD